MRWKGEKEALDWSWANRVNEKDDVGTFQQTLPEYATEQTHHTQQSKRFIGESESQRMNGHVRVGI